MLLLDSEMNLMRSLDINLDAPLTSILWLDQSVFLVGKMDGEHDDQFYLYDEKKPKESVEAGSIIYPDFGVKFDKHLQHTRFQLSYIIHFPLKCHV